MITPERELELLREIEVEARCLVYHDEAADFKQGIPPCVELRDLNMTLRALDAARGAR